ncbi:site-specific integrase [Segetibacter koreensis]|uniref:site-specific integrase n=1 Tax=Segetibacter koreensis TaxID=398037 RepID=UPI0003752E24|nr:site-specific integrase [Segetibacter koreensis]
MLLCRPTKKDTTVGGIYVRITANGKQTEISLNEKIPVNQWNVQKQEVNGRTPQVKALNTHLENVRFKIKEKYRALVDKDLPITAKGIKDVFLGNQVEQKGHSLSELVAYHAKMQGEKLSPGTMKNYVATGEYIRNFLMSKFGKDDMYLKELNHEFITELEYFIRTNPLKLHDPCEGNGIMKHLERVKKMVRWSRQLGWIHYDPFLDYKLNFKKYKRKKLDLNEVVRIEEQTFTNKSIDYVKNLFLFSCYTGLAYADVMALKPENLETDHNGRLWCKIYRQKNEEYAAIPVLSIAESIVEKYINHPKAVNRGTVFPYTSNQEVNRSLKIIGEVCGITKYMSFHLARHTFATAITLKNGVPMETVSKMLGHKRISTTQIYADVDEEKLTADMASIERKFKKFVRSKGTGSGHKHQKGKLE